MVAEKVHRQWGVEDEDVPDLEPLIQHGMTGIHAHIQTLVAKVPLTPNDAKVLASLLKVVSQIKVHYIQCEGMRIAIRSQLEKLEGKKDVDTELLQAYNEIARATDNPTLDVKQPGSGPPPKTLRGYNNKVKPSADPKTIEQHTKESEAILGTRR